MLNNIFKLNKLSYFNGVRLSTNFTISGIFGRLSSCSKSYNLVNIRNSSYESGNVDEMSFETFTRPNTTSSVLKTSSPFFNDGGEKLTAFIRSLHSTLSLSTHSSSLRLTASHVIWYFILFHILVDTSIFIAFSSFSGGLILPTSLMFILATFCCDTQTGVGKTAPGWFGRVESGYQYSDETFRSECELFLEKVVIPAFRLTVFSSLVKVHKVRNPRFIKGESSAVISEFIFVETLDPSFLTIFWNQFSLFNYSFESNIFMANVNKFFLNFNSAFYRNEVDTIRFRIFDATTSKLYLHNFRSDDCKTYWCDYRVLSSIVSSQVVTGVIFFLTFFKPEFFICSDFSLANRLLLMEVRLARAHRFSILVQFHLQR